MGKTKDHKSSKKKKKKKSSRSEKKVDVEVESNSNSDDQHIEEAKQLVDFSCSPPIAKVKETVSIADTSFRPQPTSNCTKSISQFSSWSQAFQDAESIKPHDLGDDYVDPSSTTLHATASQNADMKEPVPFGSGNVLGVSQIAVENICKSLKSGTKRTVENISPETADDGVKSPKRKKKKKKKASSNEDSHDMNVKDEEQSEEFPFPVEPDDHCESPHNAYEDIQPILDALVQIAGKKSKEKLNIYDPYYCNGSVVQHLNSLGYTKVYNKKEDCYKVWSSSLSKTTSEHDAEPQLKYPKYDVFVTNPPYSSDHIEKLIHHLTTHDKTKGKPWCLLMPNFVHKKDFYENKIASKKNKSSNLQPFYLVPKKRYVYLPPKNFREKKVSDVHKKSSPFVSMWYIWGGSKENTDLLVHAYKDWERKNKQNACDLARGKSAIRDLRRRTSRP